MASLRLAVKKPRSEEKNAIRRYISPQLEELWNIHPVFQGFGLVYQAPTVHIPTVSMSDRIDYGFQVGPSWIRSPPERVQVAPNQPHIQIGLNQPILIDNVRYISLVKSSFSLTCALEILFLRKDAGSALIGQAGDLDNRIKTLFDGLRVPKLGETNSLNTGESKAVFCLLEDDSLITDFSVRTDRLLTRPGANESEVLLIIDVTVKATQLTSNNMGFLSD